MNGLCLEFAYFVVIEDQALVSFNEFINGRRIYPFNMGLRIYGGVYHPPFDTLKIGTSTNDIKLKLYR